MNTGRSESKRVETNVEERRAQREEPRSTTRERVAQPRAADAMVDSEPYDLPFTD